MGAAGRGRDGRLHGSDRRRLEARARLPLHVPARRDARRPGRRWWTRARARSCASSTRPTTRRSSRARSTRTSNCTDPLNCVPGSAAEVGVTMPFASLNFAGGDVHAATPATRTPRAPSTIPPGAVVRHDRARRASTSGSSTDAGRLGRLGRRPGQHRPGDLRSQSAPEHEHRLPAGDPAIAAGQRAHDRRPGRHALRAQHLLSPEPDQPEGAASTSRTTTG